MTYSFTQISQYLNCPRRYRYRYLDGWKEKDTRAAMLFGRAFEQALSSYFRRDDAGAVLFREWAVYKDSQLEYSNGTTWDRMLQQGIQLLERFAQDDRIRIRQPKKNLQIKFTRSLPKGNDFVAYIDAIGHLDGTRCLLEWKTTSQSVSGRTPGTADARSSADLLQLDHRHPRCSPSRLCPQSGWSRSSTSARSSPTSNARSLAGWSMTPSDGSNQPVPSTQRCPVPSEPLHELPVRWPLSRTAGTGRNNARPASGRRSWSV